MSEAYRFVENVACMVETLGEARLLIASGKASSVLVLDPPKALYKSKRGHEERDFPPGSAVNVYSVGAQIFYSGNKEWGLFSHNRLTPAYLWHSGMSAYDKISQVGLLALMSRDADLVTSLIEVLKPIEAMLRKNE